LEIINDILDFSKIEEGRMELEVAPFELRDCIEEALDVVAPSAASKGLELGCLLEFSPPHTLLGDVTRLRQVLLNLLSNAIKFTEKGEVFVKGAVKKIDQNRCEIDLVVRDTGIGIPPEQQQTIFDSFSQVDPSITRRFGGTGLGLAICKRLVELMNGKIWVESAVGSGATFHLTIEADVVEHPAEQHPLAPTELIGKHVLIVDDNATTRLILRKQTQYNTLNRAICLTWGFST
jgi:signal transduction histidine kinase